MESSKPRSPVVVVLNRGTVIYDNPLSLNVITEKIITNLTNYSNNIIMTKQLKFYLITDIMLFIMF